MISGARGVDGSDCVGFGQNQNPKHIRYSALDPIKKPHVTTLGRVGQTHYFSGWVG
jgi:hypothetical protein